MRTTMDDIMFRDQRTTGHRVLDHDDPTPDKCTRFVDNFLYKSVQVVRIQRSQSEVVNIIKEKCRIKQYYDRPVQKTINRMNISSRVSNSCRSTTWLRLVGFLVILLMISVHGAPITMKLEERMKTPPKWMNPCGTVTDDFDSGSDGVALSDEYLLSQVHVQAKTALYHALSFCDDFAKKTFNTDRAVVQKMFATTHYDWLPGLDDIPKALDEDLDEKYLDELKIDSLLLNAYGFMQRYAVGLEQIVWDHEDHRGLFFTEFQLAEYKLKTVLCELQDALIERGVTLRPDVTRDVMPTEYRVMPDITYQNLRDWLILRDYMNGLQYVMQTFEYLRLRIKS